MDETDIIAGLKKGEESSFRFLVEHFQQKVFTTCMGLVHNPEDAEDLTQEVFIEVYRSASGFRSDSKLSTWLYRIAVNKSLNFLRANKRNKWLQSITGKTEAANHSKLQVGPGGSSHPEYELENEQRKILLQQALGGLPENQRVAFTLNKYDDLSYQEIAEILDTTIASVESLIFRAKKNLQKKLYDCYKKKCI